LFGDLYIGKHPTPNRNKYLVLKFNFSGLDTTSEENFRTVFAQKVQDDILCFLDCYKHLFPKEDDIYINQINMEQPNILSLLTAYSAAKSAGKKIYVMIDDYDYFINELIAQESTGDDVYRSHNVVFRFYELLKEGTGDVIDRIFITGAIPVSLNNIINSFNISNNLSLKKKYNEML
jgi:hypothetical protein